MSNANTITTSIATEPKRRGRPPLSEAERSRRATERKTKYRNPSKDEIKAKPGVVAGMSLPMEGRMLGIHEVCCRVNKSVSGVYSSVKAGTFPAPIKTGKRAVVWHGFDVIAWSKSPADWKPVPANDAADLKRAA